MNNHAISNLELDVIGGEKTRSWDHRVHHQRLADRVLWESYEKWRALVESVPDTIITVDRTGRILYVNRDSADDGAHSLVGRHAWECVMPEFRDSVRNSLARVFKSGFPETIEVAQLGTSGPHHWSAWRLGAVKHADEIVQLIIIISDITQHKQLEREIIQISHREQCRLGHDLHDSLGQNLTGLTFLSTILAQKLADKSLKEADDAHRIAELISQATQKIRHITRGLVPALVESNGLAAALEDLADQTDEIFDLSCHFVCHSPFPTLDSEKTNHLFRIAQEAVNNAVKHGRAKTIIIELIVLPTRCVMTIKDDGTGLSQKPKPNKGMGIHIMNYRARMIDGSLDVRCRTEGGTIVTCSFKP